MSARETLALALDRAALFLDNMDQPRTVGEITAIYRGLKEMQRKAGLEPLAWGIIVKTIAQVTHRYDDLLSRIVYDAFRSGDAVDMRRAHKALLRDLAPEAYLEGLNEGGIAEADMDDEDKDHMDETVNDWIAGQIEYVNQFARDAVDAKDDPKMRQAILDRVTMWVDSLRELGMLGKAWALQGEKGQWTLSPDVAKHTPDCIALSKLKPHRVAWFTERGYIPGNARHIGCACGIMSVKTGERLL